MPSEVEAGLFLWHLSCSLWALRQVCSGHPSSQPLRRSLSPVGGPDGSVLLLVSPQSTQAHENNKDTRLAWTGMQEHLVSTGFNQVVFSSNILGTASQELV